MASAACMSSSTRTCCVVFAKENQKEQALGKYNIKSFYLICLGNSSATSSRSATTELFFTFRDVLEQMGKLGTVSY